MGIFASFLALLIFIGAVGASLFLYYKDTNYQCDENVAGWTGISMKTGFKILAGIFGILVLCLIF